MGALSESSALWAKHVPVSQTDQAFSMDRSDRVVACLIDGDAQTHGQAVFP